LPQWQSGRRSTGKLLQPGENLHQAHILFSVIREKLGWAYETHGKRDNRYKHLGSCKWSETIPICRIWT
jgi:hypothetical protein